MKTIVIFLSLCFAASVSAQTEKKVKWYTIEEALKLNEKAPKKFMIDIYTDWCGWCKKMDAETFNHAEIAQYINAHYYPVKFNAESTDRVTISGNTYEGAKVTNGRPSPHEFAMALFSRQNRIGYPAVAYLTEKFEFISTVPGYQTPEQIEPLLHYIVEEKYMSVRLDEFQKTFVSKLKK